MFTKTLAACVAALLLAGCGGTGGTTPTQVPAPAALPAPVPAVVDPRPIIGEVPEHGKFVPFATQETVDALAFGMAPAIDNTSALVAAMGKGGRTVQVPAGDYPLSSFVVPQYTVLVLAPGVTLRDNGKLGPSDRLMNLSSNTRVLGYGARIVANRDDYTTGEQRHGVLVAYANNVSIEGLESSGHGGDGFYVGRQSGQVELINVLADNNRRNGLSIVSVVDCFVRDSVFNNSNGTNPEYGLDVEPNNIMDPVIGVQLVRVHTEGNRKGGLLIGIGLQYEGGAKADVLIVDHSGGTFRNVSRPTDDVRYVRSH